MSDPSQLIQAKEFRPRKSQKSPFSPSPTSQSPTAGNESYAQMQSQQQQMFKILEQKQELQRRGLDHPREGVPGEQRLSKLKAFQRQFEELQQKVLAEQHALRALLSQQKTIEQYKSYYENPHMIGIPIDAYGVNLSESSAFSTFVSPFAFRQSRSCDHDKLTTETFSVNVLPPNPSSLLTSFEDVTLFYIFYTNTNEPLQLDAAKELYRRNWKFHHDLQIWVKFVNKRTLLFDKTQWCIIAKGENVVTNNFETL